MPALLLESVGAGIMAGALLVWGYNRWLAGLRESWAKKLFSLSIPPAALAAGLLHGVAIAWELPRIAAAGWAGWIVVAWRAGHLMRQRRLNAGVRRRRMPLPDGIDASAYPMPVRLLFALIRPFNQADRLELVQVRAAMPGLPEGARIRLLFLTDFHVHPSLSDEYFERAIDAALARKPDAILLGGDLVSRTRHLPRAARLLAPLSAHPNVFAVRGNHDFWTRPSEAARIYAAIGARHLVNGTAILETPRGTIRILGLEHPYVPMTQRQRRVDPGPALLALVHTPEAYPLAAELGAQFAVAGHTHGGQVRLPFFGTTIASCSAPPEHVWGAGEIGAMRTFTSNGIGAFFPLRIACPPQIAEIVVEGTG